MKSLSGKRLCKIVEKKAVKTLRQILSKFATMKAVLLLFSVYEY